MKPFYWVFAVCTVFWWGAYAMLVESSAHQNLEVAAQESRK